MSLNINIPVTLPFDLIAIIKKQARDGTTIDHDRLGAALNANMKSIIEFVIAVPYDITHRSSISSPPCSPSLQMIVKSLTGKRTLIQVKNRTTASYVAQKVEAQEGLPPSHQHLFFDTTVFFDGQETR